MLVLTHPFIVGELALGNLRNRDVILSSLRALPQGRMAGSDELLHFIGRNELYGSGIGYVDAHLLASARLTAGTKLWNSGQASGSRRRPFGASLPPHNPSVSRARAQRVTA